MNNPPTIGDYVVAPDGTTQRVISASQDNLTVQVNLAAGGIDEPTTTLNVADVQPYVPSQA